MSDEQSGKQDYWDTTLERPWWRHENPDDAAQRAYSSATSLEQDQSWRKQRALLSVALYQTNAMQPGVMSGAISEAAAALLNAEVDVGFLRSAVDTLKAEVAGRVKPTVKFLTRGADWKTKRKAEGLSDFIDAVFRAPQGEYGNLWCLGPEIFQDMAIFSEGIIEVSSRLVEEDTYDITFSRQFPWELYFDEGEARYGRPRNLFRISSMSVDDALCRFVRDAEGLSEEEKLSRRQAIINAQDADDYGQKTRVVRMIKVVEAWHLKRGEDVGRHIICVNTKCLFDEEWDRERFPFARMIWEKERVGAYGHSMVEQGESLHTSLNEDIERLNTRVRLMANMKTFVTAGSVDMSKLESNDEGQIIEVAPGHQLPVAQTPQPIGASEVNWFQLKQGLFFSTLGVSEMKAASKKDPGLDSGAAIREANDLQSGRFAIPAEMYERLFVDCGLLSVDEARAVSAMGGKVKIRSEKKRKEVDFSEVELPERQVEITSHPASALSTDPGQRLATAQELFGAGLISGPVFMRLVQLPDLESELNQQTIQERYADWACGNLLDAEDEGEYIPPDDLIPNKPMVMLYVANAYLEALLAGAPELNLALMRRFIADLDLIIQAHEQKKAEQMAAAQPPAGPPAPGAPPPGAAPMPPPPMMQ